MNSQNPRRAMPHGWSWADLKRDAVVAWRLLWDPSVPGLLKLALPFMALAYFISPIDLIPIPLMPLDDIAVLMLAARLFVALAPRDSVNRAFNGGHSPMGGSHRASSRSNSSHSNPMENGEVIETTWRVVE